MFSTSPDQYFVSPAMSTMSVITDNGSGTMSVISDNGSGTMSVPASSPVINLPQLNFRQLQELINKWPIELEDQEKIFIDHATKVNSWDKTLMENGEKVSELSKSVDKIKKEHTHLERELEHLKNQQTDFEALLEPLEASVSGNVVSDPERQHLYSLAENVDVDLQQMAEDLKEMIEHINDSNKPLDKSNVVSQIMKILSDHTDVLQYIEDTSNEVKKRLIGISQQHSDFKLEENMFCGMFQ